MNLPRLLKLFLFLLFITIKTTYAQSNKTGTWGLVTIVLPVNAENRWGGYFEAQARTDEALFNRIFYYELKTGLSYAINNNAAVLVGTGRYTTYDYTDLDKGPITKENRLWEQMTFIQFLNRIKLEHRYRVEQRWVNEVYRNRFRYRLNMVVPLNHKELRPNTWLVSAFDEVFLNNKQPNFERNRISASLGYQFTNSITVLGGWINQYNNLLSGTNSKNNFILNFTYQIMRKKGNNRAELPTIKD